MALTSNQTHTQSATARPTHIMKITDALKEASKTQDKARMNRLFDQMERKGMDFMATPLICAVNLVGLKAHRFAWDCLEDWQNA